MKTTNNAQKTKNGLVKKVIVRGSAVIISLVLISWTVNAQNFWEQVVTDYNYGKLALLKIENPSEIKNEDVSINANGEKQATSTDNSTNATYEAIEAEISSQFEALTDDVAYRAAEYVEAEYAAEAESWVNAGNETNNELELSVQLEALTNNCAYNATEFVEAEYAAEAESWINENNMDAELSVQIETLTNNSAYNPSEFAEAEYSAEAESWLTGNIEMNNEVELSAQIETLTNNSAYHAKEYVEADMELEITNQKAEDDFIRKAEIITAKEADLEVEKYAVRQVHYANMNTKK